MKRGLQSLTSTPIRSLIMKCSISSEMKSSIEKTWNCWRWKSIKWSKMEETLRDRLRMESLLGIDWLVSRVSRTTSRWISAISWARRKPRWDRCPEWAASKVAYCLKSVEQQTLVHRIAISKTSCKRRESWILLYRKRIILTASSLKLKMWASCSNSPQISSSRICKWWRVITKSDRAIMPYPPIRRLPRHTKERKIGRSSQSYRMMMSGLRLTSTGN